MNLNLNNFYEYVKQGNLSCCEKQFGNNTLVSFKYTNETIYKQLWNEITLNARGITFEKETGKVVSFPFRKFFNFQELYNPITREQTELYKKVKKYQGYDNLDYPIDEQKFRCLEKLDGSCAQVFFYNKKWIVKTLGSFDSEQAIWGQKWFDRNIDKDLLNEGFTYLFEIISKEDIHPIRYDFEGMVLLSAISNDTGEEVPLSQIQNIAERLKVRMVKLYEFDKFMDAVEWAKKQPKTVEGLVITFDNGFKTKAKSDDWCQLAKMFEGMTKWNIWICYDIEKDFFHAHVDKHNSYKPVDDEVLFIPEELSEIREYAEYLRKTLEANTNEVLDIASNVKSLHSERKKQFEYVHTNYSEKWPSVMKALDYLVGKCNIKQVKQTVYKQLEPEPEK